MKQGKLLLVLLLLISASCYGQFNGQEAKLCVDRYKNINFFGLFQDSIRFKNRVLYSGAAFHLPHYFIAHCDSEMNVIWYKDLLERTWDASVNSARILNDRHGNIVISVAFYGRLWLAPGVSVSSPFSSAFPWPETIVLARYDTSGALLWYKNTWGNTSSRELGLGLDSIGAIYLSSTFSGDIGVGADTLHGAAYGDGTFFAKFDTAGSLVWIDKLSGKKNPVEGVTDPSGNMYISGRCVDTQICGTDVDTESTYRLVTAAFTATGTPSWHRFIRDDMDSVMSVSVGKDGSSVISGTLLDTARFSTLPDMYPYPSTVEGRTFICKYNLAGSEVWAKKAKGIEISRTAVDLDKNIYAGGYKSSVTTYLDTQNISVGTQGFIDLVKLDTDGSFICQLSMGNGWLSNVTFDDDNNAYSFGVAQNAWFYAGSDSARVSFSSSLTSLDYFVVKSDRNCQLKWINLLGKYFHSDESVPENEGRQILQLYPNPVKERMQVELPFLNFSEAELAVYDASGNTNSTTSFMGSSYVLDTRVLSEGVHFVRVITSTGTYWGKFIKH